MIRSLELPTGEDQPIPFFTPDLPAKAPLTLPDEENTVTSLLEHNLLSPRERTVVQRIATVYPDLHELFPLIYPDKGWRVCTPACSGLSRIISFDFGIPIGQNMEGEHLEICVGVFDPVDSPLPPEYASANEMRMARLEEHSYVKYYAPTGNVFFADIIYPFLFKTETRDGIPILVEQYSPNTIDLEIARRHNIFSLDMYPFSNVYYATGPYWNSHIGMRDGRVDQNRRTAAFHADLLTMQYTANLVACDEFLVYIINDTEYFINEAYPLLQAIASSTAYHGLFERMEDMHPDCRGQKMIAQLRLLAAVSAHTEK